MKVLFVEPPKDVWFVMGEYLPPPYGIIQLAAYLEREVKNVEIEVLDCNAQQLYWEELEKRIQSFNPDVVASSALATCNTYVVARTLETAKRVNPNFLTVAGGQHFTATAQESLETYPEIDVIVRGEGEQTFAELVRNAEKRSSLPEIKGISFRYKGRIFHNPPRPLIGNLDDLPYPGYHFVKDIVHKYHFAAMAGRKAPYALIEGSRGCLHRCTFCTQWRHWHGTWRQKSPRRIADEMEFCYQNYGSRFIWLTDDNFGSGKRASSLTSELLQRKIGDDLTWFLQWRCDDVVRNRKLLPKMREAGLNWVMVGVESPRDSTLERFKKGITPEGAKKAVRLLKENDIFAHTMFIMGERRDTAESIAYLREFVNELDPDFALFTALTPFPGTEIFEEAKRSGWIEDFNWSHYDMAHAIMPTETLSREDVQEELYKCYRSFYGSWGRRVKGLFSRNELKRRIYWYMAGRGIIKQFRNLF
ncbi:MAG: B12-binding domain-containing radical SAM protein [Candidatus Bathyarchaeota archaeon]|nr:B12-binding domain-containing radical SAM protein [Candidatus Bathyarchaeota archaeon]MDH5732674.1 B12-binding domain-containing radical SAM protein [Candidatus Bathyarchaeota archaeon]